MRLIHRKIGIWDQTNNKLLVFSSILEGVDGAAAFYISNDREDLQIEDGQTVLNDITPTLDGRFLQTDSTDLSDLNTIATSQEPVHVILLGVGHVAQFSDYEVSSSKITLSVNENYSSNNVLQIVGSKKTTAAKFDSSGIKSRYFNVNENLFATRQWADNDSNGLADLWSFDGTSESFAGGIQTLQYGSTGQIFDRSVFFPFDGETLTFSITVDALGANFLTGDLNLKAYNISDVQQGSTSSTEFTGTGRTSVQLTVPATTAYVTAEVELTGSDGVDLELQVSDPALTTNGSTTFNE